MIHILHVLTVGFAHIHNAHALLRYDLNHGAIKLLLSGQTSESPTTRCQAFHLLVSWLIPNHVAPVDW